VWCVVVMVGSAVWVKREEGYMCVACVACCLCSEKEACCMCVCIFVCVILG